MDEQPQLRRFNTRLGDRVARVPGEGPLLNRRPTTNISEAVEHANLRAQNTGHRMRVQRHTRHGWWLIFQTETPLKLGDKEMAK